MKRKIKILIRRLVLWFGLDQPNWWETQPDPSPTVLQGKALADALCRAANAAEKGA